MIGDIRSLRTIRNGLFERCLRRSTIKRCFGPVVAVLLMLQVATPDPPTHRTMSVGTAYAVRVTDEQACIALANSGGNSPQDYLLIVGSLGDASRTYEISLAKRQPPFSSRFSQLANRDQADMFTALPPASVARHGDSAVGTARVPRDRSTAPIHLLNATQPQGSASRAEILGLTSGKPEGKRLPIRPVHSTERPLEPSESSRVFFLHTGAGSLNDPAEYSAVTARRIASGHTVAVWLDRQVAPRDLAPGLAETIVRRLEHELIPAMGKTFGRCRDIDGSGTFTVLLTPWLERLQAGQTSLKGFVRSSDFDAHAPQPFSNRCDMLYLNSHLTTGPELTALLAHEFTHAISISERLNRTQRDPGNAIEEDWLNEGLAHLAENLYSDDWSNLDHRIDAYLAATADHPLVVPDYYRAGLWRNHGCRGATYLFLRWCVDLHGTGILRNLVQSPATGTRNIAWNSGERFEVLFRRWSVAVALTAGDAQHSHAAEQQEFRTIDLRSRIGRFALQGVNTTPFVDSDVPQRYQIRGTAFRVFRVRSSLPEFTIRAEPGARLQVTLIPIAARIDP